LWQLFKADLAIAINRAKFYYRSRWPVRIGIYLATVVLGVVIIAIHDIDDDETRKNIAAVGAFFGLGGIPVVAILNAHFARKRDDAIRLTETRAIVAALKAEMDVYLRAIRITLKSRTSEPPDSDKKVLYGVWLTGLQKDLKHPIHSDVYRSVLNRIGGLGPGLATEIVSFYTRRVYVGFDDDVTKLSEEKVRGSYETLVDWVKGYQEHGERLSVQLGAFLTDADRATISDR